MQCAISWAFHSFSLEYQKQQNSIHNNIKCFLAIGNAYQIFCRSYLWIYHYFQTEKTKEFRQTFI